MEFSSESEDDMHAITGESIFNQTIDLDKELEKATVPKPLIKKVEPTIDKAHYLMEAANKRAQEKANVMAKHLESIKKDDTPVELFKLPAKSVKIIKPKLTLGSREQAILSYKSRSTKRKRLDDVL